MTETEGTTTFTRPTNEEVIQRVNALNDLDIIVWIRKEKKWVISAPGAQKIASIMGHMSTTIDNLLEGEKSLFISIAAKDELTNTSVVASDEVSRTMTVNEYDKNGNATGRKITKPDEHAFSKGTTNASGAALRKLIPAEIQKGVVAHYAEKRKSENNGGNGGGGYRTSPPDTAQSQQGNDKDDENSARYRLGNMTKKMKPHFLATHATLQHAYDAVYKKYNVKSSEELTDDQVAEITAAYASFLNADNPAEELSKWLGLVQETAKQATKPLSNDDIPF